MKVKVTVPYTNAKTVWELSSYVGKQIRDKADPAPGQLEAIAWEMTELRRVLSYLIDSLVERNILTLADVKTIILSDDKMEK